MWKKERDSNSQNVKERMRFRKRERLYDIRKRECVIWERERERERMCVMSERERSERERSERERSERERIVREREL